MTTLCFDFGNTRLKAAVFTDEILQQTSVLEDDPVSSLRKMIQQFKPSRSILSSVINEPPEIEQLLRKHTVFHRLTHESKLPFTIPVGKPETVGGDRLAIAAASVFLFPKKK